MAADSASSLLDSTDTTTEPDDWSGVGDLLTLAVDRVADSVEGVHRAVNDRWLGAITDSDSPVRSAATAATTTLYGAVRLAGSVLGAAANHNMDRAGRRPAASPSRTAAIGRSIRVTANGVWGDELDRRSSALSIGMSLRSASGDSISGSRLTGPGRTSADHLIVLVHGWSEDERCWFRTPDDTDRPGLVHSLESDERATLLVRYNTGRHVSQNGRSLAMLLDAAVQAWPVDVRQIVLVVHSMG